MQNLCIRLLSGGSAAWHPKSLLDSSIYRSTLQLCSALIILILASTASAQRFSGYTVENGPDAIRLYLDHSSFTPVLSVGLLGNATQREQNKGVMDVKARTGIVRSLWSDSYLSQYRRNFNAVSKWMSQFSQSDGSILYTPQEIIPYYSNIAAIGMTRDPNRMPQVVAWMNWYTNHLNWPDKWGLYGTIYDYTVNNGQEISTNDADSTDSYAGTFLTLAWNAWATGDAGARSYIAGIYSQLDAIGGVIIKTQNSDGLTWAKPDYQIKYLMDNSEAYRGLRDAASLFKNAFHDNNKAAYYNAAADAMQNGIFGMWLNGNWAVYKDGVGKLAAPNMNTWYADATAQVFPVLLGVVTSSDTRAKQAYAAFNSAWPGWPSLSFNTKDPFPWCLVGDAAAAMGDKTRLITYIKTIQTKYENSNFPWPFYIAEAGWFIRGNNFMLGHGL